MSAILPFRLTVEQYACIIQRCTTTVRRDIRARKIEAEGTPYLIHARELPGVIDVPLALARLSDAGLLPPPARQRPPAAPARFATAHSYPPPARA
jgi:hypothetical protein